MEIRLVKLYQHGFLNPMAGNCTINCVEQCLNGRRQRIILEEEILNYNSVMNGINKFLQALLVSNFIYINDVDLRSHKKQTI